MTCPDFLVTGHMTRQHTHLVSKSTSGEKHKKAVEWGITVVTPKWLGDMIQTGQSFPCKTKTRYAVIGGADELTINPTFSTHITDIWNDNQLVSNQREPKSQKYALL